jgi:hypothetical protein
MNIKLFTIIFLLIAISTMTVTCGQYKQKQRCYAEKDAPKGSLDCECAKPSELKVSKTNKSGTICEECSCTSK